MKLVILCIFNVVLVVVHCRSTHRNIEDSVKELINLDPSQLANLLKRVPLEQRLPMIKLIMKHAPEESKKMYGQLAKLMGEQAGILETLRYFQQNQQTMTDLIANAIQHSETLVKFLKISQSKGKTDNIVPYMMERLGVDELLQQHGLLMFSSYVAVFTEFALPIVNEYLKKPELVNMMEKMVLTGKLMNERPEGGSSILHQLLTDFIQDQSVPMLLEKVEKIMDNGLSLPKMMDLIQNQNDLSKQMGEAMLRALDKGTGDKIVNIVMTNLLPAVKKLFPDSFGNVHYDPKNHTKMNFTEFVKNAGNARADMPKLDVKSLLNGLFVGTNPRSSALLTLLGKP